MSGRSRKISTSSITLFFVNYLIFFKARFGFAKAYLENNKAAGAPPII
jgi:hypothetical protein